MGYRTQWSEAEIRRLIKAFEESDLPVKEIAIAIGRSHGATRGMLATLRAEGRIGYRKDSGPQKKIP